MTHNADNDARPPLDLKPPVDLDALAIEGLTEQERDDFIAALADARVTPPAVGA